MTSKHRNLTTLQHALFLQILVPIHQDIHWCLAVINIRDKKLEYLDSLQGGDNTVLKVLVSLLSLAHTTSYRRFIFLFEASSYPKLFEIYLSYFPLRNPSYQIVANWSNFSEGLFSA